MTNDGYVRDPKSLAIINTDQQAYREYIFKRNEAVKITELNKEVSVLKNELSEIKQMLQILINGKTNG